MTEAKDINYCPRCGVPCFTCQCGYYELVDVEEAPDPTPNWMGKYFHALYELAKANKGIRRLKKKLDDAIETEQNIRAFNNSLHATICKLERMLSDHNGAEHELSAELERLKAIARTWENRYNENISTLANTLKQRNHNREALYAIKYLMPDPHPPSPNGICIFCKIGKILADYGIDRAPFHDYDVQKPIPATTRDDEIPF